jgi:Holliday junction DNA helicase RuvA
MIGQLRGQLLAKKPSLVLVDVHGVAYEVHIPVTTFYDLPGEGGEVVLKIHTHVREDALLLYGFGTQREKDFFLKLVAVSGIGPKVALAILSGARVEELAHAVSTGDAARLTRIPGVGRKTADRMVLELKSVVAPFMLAEEATAPAAPPATDALQEDVLSALVNLGYARPASEKALAETARTGNCERTFEDLLRGSLRRLAG